MREKEAEVSPRALKMNVAQVALWPYPERPVGPRIYRNMFALFYTTKLVVTGCCSLGHKFSANKDLLKSNQKKWPVYNMWSTKYTQRKTLMDL